MSFFCPTFQRPNRLRDLADSWQEYAYGMPLQVRVWDKDPFKEEYLSQSWPDDWTVYVSSAEWTGEALQEFFEMDSERDYFGFIGDDVVLETSGAVEDLVKEAGRFYIAYPNDKIQRHHLATHFCLGGDLVRIVGYLVPPGIRHHYLDQVWHTIGLNTGLLRYRPDIIFNHRHMLRGQADNDATYQRVWEADGKTLKAQMEEESRAIFQLWLDKRAGKDIGAVKRRLLKEFEGFSDEELEEMKNGQG